ncbi:MAG: hypothetical protein KDK39_19810 [Leptospiraceae bacterium]|nr:hypothetical protein [Leptospiraceae bacterium]
MEVRTIEVDLDSPDFTQRALDGALREFQHLKTVDHPVVKKYLLPQAVRDIEELRLEYDRQTGFNEHQISSHAIALRIDTTNHGKISAPLFAELVRKFQSIVDKVNTNSAQLYVAGLAYGSAVLLADIEPVDDQIKKPAADKIKSDITKSLKKTLKESQKLCRSGEPEEQAIAFQESIGDSGTAAEIASSVNSFIPTPALGLGYIEISLPSQDFSVKFEPADRQQFRKVRQVLNRTKKFKDGTQKIVYGELGEGAEWSNSEKHSFTVKPDGEKRVKIFYSANESDDSIVKNSLGGNVKVQIEFKGNKWQLLQWVKG